MAACSLLLGSPQVAVAYNIQLDDVENPQMQEGVRAATMGEFRRAEKIFNEMLREDPSWASVWSNRGNVRMSLGRADEAAADYDRAVELAPDAPVPYLNRAIAYEQLGLELQDRGEQGMAETKWRAAVSDCQKAIELDPKEFAAWFNKGNVEMRLGRYEDAEESFRQGADLAPGIPGYRLRQAQVMFENGSDAGAIRLARTVVRKNNQYAEAHASLAAMYYADNMIALAEDEFNKATDLEPDFLYRDRAIASVRWPPKLIAAYTNFLSLGSTPAAEPGKS